MTHHGKSIHLLNMIRVKSIGFAKDTKTRPFNIYYRILYKRGDKLVAAKLVVIGMQPFLS